MEFVKFLGIPVFIAFQAFTMMLLTKFGLGCKSEVFAGYGAVVWISFQAWAMYFLAGCTPVNGLKTLAGYLGGIVCSICIFELGDVMTASMGSGYWGYAITVFIVVIGVICAEKVPGFNFVASWFIGAGVFFAFMQGYMKVAVPHTMHGYLQVAVPELIACAVGLVYGYVTVTFRVWYEPVVGLNQPAAAAVENEETKPEPVAEVV